MNDYNNYKDVRSASIDAKRNRTHRAKYNYFANTNEGLLTEPHYIDGDNVYPVFALPRDAHMFCDEWTLVSGLPKRKVHKIAQISLRKNEGGCYCCTRIDRERELEYKRGMRGAKREARNWEDEWSNWKYVDDLDGLDREVEHELDWYAQFTAPDVDERRVFDVTPLLEKAEREWMVGEKKNMEKLGWVDAWDDEHWVSDDDGEWLELDLDEVKS